MGAKKGISSVSVRMEDLFILSFLLRSSNLSFSPFPGTEGLKTAGTAYLTSSSSSADSATEMNYKCCGTCPGWYQENLNCKLQLEDLESQPSKVK